MSKGSSTLFLILFLNLPIFSEPNKKLEVEIHSNQQTLEKIHQKLETLQQKKIQLKKEEDTLQSKINKLKTEIGVHSKKQVQIGNQLKIIQIQVTRLNHEIYQYSEAKSEQEENLMNDLRKYEIHSLSVPRWHHSGFVQWIWKESIRDRFHQMTLDQSLELESSQKKIEEIHTQLKLASLKTHLHHEIQTEKKSQKEESNLYQTTREQRILTEEEVRHLVETRQSLEKYIADLMKREEVTTETKIARQKILAQKGYLPWPVQGTVVSKFGKYRHPTLGVLLIQNGIKIQTNQKCSIQSVAKGKVVYASEFRSYGRTIIIDHGGDLYSIYGLLGKILVPVGKKVGAGEIIGKPIDSRNPQIYFEFRQEGKPEDPLLWLKPY